MINRFLNQDCSSRYSHLWDLSSTSFLVPNWIPQCAAHLDNDNGSINPSLWLKGASVFFNTKATSRSFTEYRLHFVAFNPHCDRVPLTLVMSDDLDLIATRVAAKVAARIAVGIAQNAQPGSRCQ